MSYTVVIGSDHAGYELKEDLKVYIEGLGHIIRDVGTGGVNSVHYPIYAARVAQELSSKVADRGILICGSGIGMSIVANRFPGVRAALCHDLYTALLSRWHNDANCLVMGGRIIGKGLAREMVKAWLDAQFEGGRHKRRLDLIEEIERDILSCRGGG